MYDPQKKRDRMIVRAIAFLIVCIIYELVWIYLPLAFPLIVAWITAANGWKWEDT